MSFITSLKLRTTGAVISTAWFLSLTLLFASASPSLAQEAAAGERGKDSAGDKKSETSAKEEPKEKKTPEESAKKTEEPPPEKAKEQSKEEEKKSLLMDVEGKEETKTTETTSKKETESNIFTLQPTQLLLLDLKPQGVAKGEADTLTSLLSAAIKEFGKYSLYTNQDVRDILGHKQQQQLLGCDTPECMVDIGKALEAEKVVGGSVGISGQWKVLHLALMDTQSMDVVNRVTVVIKSEEKVVEYVRRAAAQLLGEEYTKGEAIIVEKNQHYFHIGVLRGMSYEENFEILPLFAIAYLPRFNNMLVGLETTFTIAENKTDFDMPGNPLVIADKIYMFDFNLKAFYSVFPDNDWATPYAGLAGGVSLDITSPSGEGKDRELEPLEDYRLGRTQLGWNIQPVIGGMFFPSYNIGLFLEARYRFGSKLDQASYKWSAYKYALMENVEVDISGIYLSGGIHLGFK
ncbi:MAG: hypothetical protein Kow0090_06880 [Myxococcota bacterium]